VWDLRFTPGARRRQAHIAALIVRHIGLKRNGMSDTYRRLSRRELLRIAGAAGAMAIVPAVDRSEIRQPLQALNDDGGRHPPMPSSRD
jgi:porphobilinogen deaminase